MKKVFDKIEQRGTLLVEAIAMLGLIAMVTPTLYKKSAERLQEIQDINAASQARIFNNVIETFVKNNFTALKNATSSGTAIKINYEDSSSGYFDVGYSSYLPFGYNMDTIKNYTNPEIYIHQDGSSLISYIFYPYITDPGQKRAARLASLVGANGGMVTAVGSVQGTGGAWYLDDDMLNTLGVSDAGGNLSPLKANNLVITAEEPIEDSTEDNDKYLYRVPAENEEYHNTMVTNLYMGGHPDLEKSPKASASDFHNIFNVRKLTLNTKCTAQYVKYGTDSSAVCDPNVADLYIGKPWGRFASDQGGSSSIMANTGAAWIYGNLSALNDGFKLIKHDSSMVSELFFRATDDSSGVATENLLYATGDVAGTSSTVEMVGKFVRINKVGGEYEYVIGSSSAEGVGDELFVASALGVGAGASHQVHIGKKKDATVYIAEKGGSVYINAGSSGSSSNAVTYINNAGGLVQMGANDGEWLHAGGEEGSAYVHILQDGVGQEFRVGSDGSSGAMILAKFRDVADGEEFVSLHGQRIRTSDKLLYSSLSTSGGVAVTGLEAMDGFTAVTTKYTDIFGSTYLGSEPMGSTNAGDGTYIRGAYTLGVAGSAWVDEFLWARQAWFNDAGMKSFHAGFENRDAYLSHPKTGWLNVYGPGSSSGAEGGSVIIRNPNRVVNANNVGDADDVMFLASSGTAIMSDTEGAWLQLERGETRLGSQHNYFYADVSDSSGVSGSSYVVGGKGVGIYTEDAGLSSAVDLQNGAMMLYGYGSSATFDNKIHARAGEFALKTGSSGVGNDDVQFYANKDKIRTRYVDFEVQKDGDSTKVFGVYPQMLADANSGSANVEIKGSLHVSGNEVIHIASNDANRVDNSSHAMFEIDPNYIRVWAKDEVNNRYGDGGEEYYAMLTINPTDIDGSSLAITDPDKMNDTSIYVRRGAIELMKSVASDGASSSTYGADEGFGYIRANRLVSNAGMNVPGVGSVNYGGTDRGSEIYDQFMVNPAYTSVMHDIKLTSRGNARLSDILPDFVLKGVYNVSNDYIEGTDKRTRWSAGDDWCNRTGKCEAVDVTWASPYLGKIPYGMCPPGYKNMTTVVPISFQIGRAGRLVKSAPLNGFGTDSKWMLGEPTRQADILLKAGSEDKLMYPKLEEVKSFVLNDIFQSSDAFSSFVATASTVTEGWYWGVKQNYSVEGNPVGGYSVDTVDGRQVGMYSNSEGSSFALADPLYFQEGTFLKTSLVPQSGADAKGWEARMGFVYNKNHWSGLINGHNGTGIVSDYTAEDGEPLPGMLADYVWNLFPVPTNTLEGHATVYCYFDRKQFGGNEVLQFDAMDDSYTPFNKTNLGGSSNADEYIKRLNDPSLRYNEPW